MSRRQVSGLDSQQRNVRVWVGTGDDEPAGPACRQLAQWLCKQQNWRLGEVQDGSCADSRLFDLQRGQRNRHDMLQMDQISTIISLSTLDTPGAAHAAPRTA